MVSEVGSFERPEEFHDYEGDLSAALGEFQWSALTSPESIRGLVSIVAGTVLLLLESPSSRVRALLIGVVLLVVAFGHLIQARRAPAPEIAGNVGLAGLGVAFIVWPDITSGALALLVGAGVAASGLSSGYRAWRSTERDKAWLYARSAFLLAFGAAITAAPGVFVDLALTLVIIVWVLSGLITVVTNLRSSHQISITGAWSRFADWLAGRPYTVDDRTQLYEKLFFEGDQGPRRVSRFFILMFFATAIAAFGIASDSTAVVIGAMLVAPLMTPLMATSLASVMGWPRRALLSALVALGGIGLAIGFSVMVGAALPFDLSSANNSQIASRVAPTLVDLAIAVAAGAAGAFALARYDVSDALPGVAVAIALVPPLAVVGLMIQAGQGVEAVGALLLFTTNLVAILLVGAVVFVLTGVVPVTQIFQNRGWIRTTLTLVGSLALLVVAVLGVSSDQISAEAFQRDEAERVVEEWLGDSSLTVFDLDVSSSEVIVTVVGPNEPPPVRSLGEQMETQFEAGVDVRVRWVPEELYVYESPD